jgi:hypothetical protein
MEENVDEEPIFELATECEKLFADQVSRLEGGANGAAIVSELSHRFATWAAFLGVFAESRVCLDRRLQHHVEIQDRVLRLLDLVRRNLEYRMASSRPHM